jgi:hypothetical protein
MPTFAEVASALAGQIGLEVELKGPEPERVDAVVPILAAVGPDLPSMEVTSFEPALLASMRMRCLSLWTALLCPRSEPWMGFDIVSHLAIQRAL